MYMGLMRHLRQCNHYTAEIFLPLLHRGTRLGLVRRDNADRLRRFPDIFRVEADHISVAADGDFERLSRAVDDVVEVLVGDGVIPKWRNEFFAVAPSWGAAPHFRLDRGAVPYFGTRAHGVHLNGYRRDGGRLMLWIGKRAADKQVAPGKLDNLVAGGIDWQHGVEETLAKEAGEEAAIPPALIARARAAGSVSYRMETKLGLRDDTLFVYDLEVPADFEPRNTDGEITDFTLMDAREVLALVEAGDAFKFNVNLVIIDFALRHGLMSPAEPGGGELVKLLRSVPI
jgi:8-oxo-dGTP pyrophosphatase MutT (NUDIX family)